MPEGAGSAYVRLARVEGSFAIVNAAAVVERRPAGDRDRRRDRHARARRAGRRRRRRYSEEALEQIGDAAYEACEDAYGDLSGSAEYRRELARVYARRAVAGGAGRPIRSLTLRKEETDADPALGDGQRPGHELQVDTRLTLVHMLRETWG